MRTKVMLRDVTSDERAALERLARSRTTAVRLVERVRIILAAIDGRRPSLIAAQLHVTRTTVSNGIHRFNANGLAGLHDRPRSGCPPTYSADQKAEVIATALSDPKTRGLEFGSWTRDRLVT